MPREKEGFRDNLVRLDEKFPGRELLNMIKKVPRCTCCGQAFKTKWHYCPNCGKPIRRVYK